MSLLRTRPAITISVRFFQPDKQPHDTGTYRGEKVVRFGYQAHHHDKGLLPRLKLRERRLGTIPIGGTEDPWSNRLARMGENDLVRIFGNEDMEQHELLTHIPEWLRGYRGHSEYEMLMQKRKEFEHWRYTKPLRWLHMEQRIKFLYRRINNKYKPPDVEKLGRSRYTIE